MSEYKQKAKEIFEYLKCFYLGNDINCWVNFDNAKKTEGRLQSLHFEKDFIRLLPSNQELFEIILPKSNGKNSISFYDFSIKCENSIYPVNLKYVLNNNIKNNVNGGKGLVNYILRNKYIDDKNLKITKVLINWYKTFINKEKINHPYFKDYFLFIVVKNEKTPILDISYCSIFDIIDIYINQSQTIPGLQFEAKKYPWNNNFCQLINEKKLFNWIIKYYNKRSKDYNILKGNNIGYV